MIRVAGSNALAQRLVKLLGLEWAEKVVIEIAVRDLVRIYVKGPIDGRQLDKVLDVLEIQLVEDAQVEDDCSVIVTRSESRAP